GDRPRRLRAAAVRSAPGDGGALRRARLPRRRRARRDAPLRLRGRRGGARHGAGPAPAAALLMGTRRAARELALQALYQLDVAGEEEADAGLALFWSHFEQPPEVQRFARELVEGVRAERARIDRLIAASAEHWRLPRLSRVDLAVLRL